MARFRVASTPRYFDRQANEWKDGEALFLTVNAWRQLAENAAESLTRGSRVVVTGRLRQRTYEKNDEKRTVYELEADEVAVSLRNATAKISKADRAKADPWAAEPAGGFSDEPPFRP